MSEAVLNQVKHWHTAVKQAHKCIYRRNKYINRLLNENRNLTRINTELNMKLAILELDQHKSN